ncbi:hypothetical protein X743_27260 [Mesorhizobium sp. LNHC252B00]|nr:hypothetical protein X743_27260 [Mesorhizobium sp. LNHC252B00]
MGTSALMIRSATITRDKHIAAPTLLAAAHEALF